MRPDARDRREDRREGQGGIPDGLLIGILAFLLGMTLLVWTATGLAALFAKGAWPHGVTFTRTPLAMRHLIGEPHDIAGAWPDTPASQLSGWGLFWGLFIGQLMILFVLTVFVMGAVARWRAGRARARAQKPIPTAPEQRYEVPVERYEVPVERYEVPVARTEPEPAEAVQAPQPRVTPPDPAPQKPLAPLSADGEMVDASETARPNGPVLYAPPAARQTAAAQAVRDAEGPALVVTSNPALWSETKDARAKLGPTLLYDPTHLCDTPARLHWSPTTGCEDKQTALSRATALLGPVQPTARIDQTVADTAVTLLRSYLHAAALENRTVRHVHRWSQGIQVQDAVRTLRTHPKAAPGAAGELEAALTAHPERRDIAQELTNRALSALSTVNIREACTPNRTDALSLDSFVHEGGTLYVVGESIEDSRSNPGAMPLLTALVSSVVERGRRMAERSSSGRLDPPLTLVLDDIAAVAPVPQLPDLLATGTEQGLPTLALLRSREQARSRWPHRELPV
ncbi:type IV secretory system conjugative DNA transfer family protein [Streptomyces sp. NPDC007856]|uniref:type IV secretory system conjugative DNA transfer family protein n=1 Tax=Streptomyces sp. NPDC007856 TaxID=3364781 RepID=UPI0036C64869